MSHPDPGAESPIEPAEPEGKADEDRRRIERRIHVDEQRREVERRVYERRSNPTPPATDGEDLQQGDNQ